MICIWRSTSTSRSAACTTRSTSSRLAASSAPRCISMKNGLFSVFSTSAMRGRRSGCRLPIAPRKDRDRRKQCKGEKGTTYLHEELRCFR